MSHFGADTRQMWQLLKCLHFSWQKVAKISFLQQNFFQSPPKWQHFYEKKGSTIWHAKILSKSPEMATFEWLPNFGRQMNRPLRRCDTEVFCIRFLAKSNLDAVLLELTPRLLLFIHLIFYPHRGSTRVLYALWRILHPVHIRYRLGHIETIRAAFLVQMTTKYAMQFRLWFKKCQSLHYYLLLTYFGWYHLNVSWCDCYQT